MQPGRHAETGEFASLKTGEAEASGTGRISGTFFYGQMEEVKKSEPLLIKQQITQ